MSNIINGIKYLQEDFISFSFNATLILEIFVNVFISIIIILTFFQLGRKIRKFFLKSTNNEGFNYFVDIALGYIFVGTGILILGLLSILYYKVLLFYLLSIFLLAIYPFNDLAILIKKDSGVFLKKIKYVYAINKWIFSGICIFLLISFLRLIPPEIGEDSIGYHTDLPTLYLKNHTMIIASKEDQRILPSPQLGEMSYVITDLLGHKDASRYVHFTFYLLIILLLVYWRYDKKNNFSGLYSALLFITASVVIRHASKANVDYQWLYCWLISIIVLTKSAKPNASDIAVSGIVFGGVMATKLWTIAFLPTYLIYILIRFGIKKNSPFLIFIFLLTALCVSCLWYFRAYIITGNPVYPAFLHSESNTPFSFREVFTYIGFNTELLSINNLIAFSPLFFLSIAFIFFKFLKKLLILKRIYKNGIFLFFILLALEHFVIKYYLGRYLLGIYLIGVIIVAILTEKLTLFKNILFKITFVFITTILIVYYFLSTLLILPYGLGWADNNKYLTRVLYRDNSSYYNFDNLFDKWITNSDLVATYGIYGYYYANFSFIDVNYVFDLNSKSFDTFNKKKVTKLLIKGGNILWFCKNFKLANCSENKVKLLVSYPRNIGKFNLYELIKN